jgi:hypothetical protein
LVIDYYHSSFHLAIYLASFNYSYPHHERDYFSPQVTSYIEYMTFAHMHFQWLIGLLLLLPVRDVSGGNGGAENVNT